MLPGFHQIGRGELVTGTPHVRAHAHTAACPGATFGNYFAIRVSPGGNSGTSSLSSDPKMAKGEAEAPWLVAKPNSRILPTLVRS